MTQGVVERWVVPEIGVWISCVREDKDMMTCAMTIGVNDVGFIRGGRLKLGVTM